MEHKILPFYIVVEIVVCEMVEEDAWGKQVEVGWEVGCIGSIKDAVVGYGFAKLRVLRCEIVEW